MLAHATEMSELSKMIDSGIFKKSEYGPVVGVTL